MLGKRLEELRTLAGLSARELDRLAGLREGHSWLLEHNENPNPELRTIAAFCRVLGCTYGYLAAGEGKRPSRAAVIRAVEAARAAHGQATGTDGGR